MKRILIVLLFSSLSIHAAVEPIVCGESLWCITRKIGSGIDVLEQEIESCCSELNSKLDHIINSETSVINNLESCCENLNSKLDIIINGNDSILENLDSCCENLNSKIDITIAGNDSILAEIDSCCAELNSKLDQIISSENSILSNLESCCEELNSKVDVLLNCCTPVYAEQVETSGITLNEPGTYVLQEDVVFNGGNNSSAFTISSSNVTLDMACHTVTQGNASTNVNAVNISSGLNDIEILGGKIYQFTANGILVNNNNTRIHIHDLSILNGEQGITLNGSVGNLITDSSLKDIEIAGLNSYAVFLLNTQDIYAKNITVTNITENSGNGIFFIQDSTKANLRNILLNDNTTTFGLRLNNVTASNFDNVIVNNNNASTLPTQFNAISLTDSNTNVLQHCQTNNNQANQLYLGFGFTNSSQNKIIDCSAINNSIAQTTIACVGFSVSSSSANNYFYECLAIRNIALNASATPPNFASIGFVLDSSTNCTLNKCSAINQDSTTSAVGIQLNNATGCTILSCVCADQDIGFRLDGSTTANVFLQNIATKNTTNYSGFPVTFIQEAATTDQINGQLTNPWTNVGVN